MRLRLKAAGRGTDNLPVARRLQALLMDGWEALPKGGSLPEDVWSRRHQGLMVVLWLHLPLFAALAVARGQTGVHVIVEVVAVGVFAALGRSRHLKRPLRAAVVTIGLVYCSALLVHLTGGLIEAHFHFFVVISLIGLYVDWTPFLVALAVTVVHHGSLGMLAPSAVFNHGAAQEKPWLWAALHGGFVLAASAATLIAWKLNEVATRTQELARLSRQYEAILRSVGDGIYGVDLQGIVSFANPAAASALGYELGDLVGRPAHDLFPTGDRQEGDVACHAVVAETDSGRSGTDSAYSRADGTTFPVEYVATPIRDGGPVSGVVVVFRDVSERRAVERLKDEFISVVSHELRTPLTSIRGSLGLLAGGVLGELAPKGQRMADIALQNTDRLVRLINDILDIERMQTGKSVMQKRYCDVGALLEQSVDVMRSMADEAGVLLRLVALRATVFVDPDRMIQTLTNLVSNAIKFSPAGGSVVLSAERTADEVVIRVRDEGRGIPSDQLERVFERFQQVNSSDSRDKGGTGLGLAICRSIVEQHEGRIWADSELGQGTTFSFTLPAAAAEREVHVARPLAGQSTVLVCDDDPSVVEVTEAVLQAHGYHTIGASCGQEALDQALAHRPTVILLDLLMPGMSGWQTLAGLKRRPETEDIPVVILSGLNSDEGTDLRGNVAGWVEKPAQENALVRAIESAASGPDRRPLVLVVEDDADLAGVITASFEHHHLEVVVASTGREAVWFAQELVPDLVVLDLHLPDAEGFSVVDALREDRRLNRVPLVVYTASELDAAARAKLRLGQTIYLTKSRVTPEQFENRVMDLLRRVTREQRVAEVPA